MPNKSTSPMEPSDDIATNCHPRAGGDPVRRGRSIQSLASLEYPPARVTTIAYDFRDLAARCARGLRLVGLPRNRGRRETGCSDLSIIGWRRSSVSRDEAQRTRATRRLTRVVRVVDAVRDRHLGEIERAYPVQARHVHGI